LWSDLPAPWNLRLQTPGSYPQSISRRWIVEVPAAFGLPLPSVSPFTVAALAGAFDLGGGPFEAGPDLVGLDVGDRALVALGGLPAALAQPPGDHDPVTLGQGPPAGLEVVLASRKLDGLIVTEVNPTTIPAASSPVWSTIRSRRSPDSRQLGPELRTIRS
jgi:hypothetical protein